MPAHVLVLGGGAAGIACALRLGELDVRATLVDAGEGRALAAGRAKRLLAARIDDAAAGAEAYRHFRQARDRRLRADAAARADDLARHGVRRVAAPAVIERLDPPRLRAGATRLGGDALVLAVGARPRPPAWCGPGTQVVTADRLYLDDGPLPARLVVLGGGWQATGAAGLFRALGCEVTLVFADADPLAGFDAELRRHVGDALAGAGVRLRPQTRVSAVTAGGRRRAVETDAGVLAAERVVLAGDGPPIPNTDHLGLAALGVATTPEGAVYVDTRYATRRAGVFAIGDCADHAGHGLAPATFDYASIAAVEGRRLAEHLAGAPPAPLDYDREPLIVPGRPALATVGLAEDRARALGLRVAARGRTLDGDRFAKLVVDADGGEVLGCHLAGAGAGAALEPVVAALAADADAATLARRLAAPAAAADPFAEELVAQARELG